VAAAPLTCHVAVPGTTSIKHLKENASAAHVDLNAAEVRAIAEAVDRAGLPSWRPLRDT
jgi:aryl-alcohol dehydrogenase-like predicted oxidoreductase